MAGSEVKLVRQLGGSVEAVRALMGVATESYEDLKDKPSINGVVLRGNVNFGEQGVSGLCFYVLNTEVGDLRVLRVDEYDVITYGRTIQFGDVILTKDKKLFTVDKLNISASSSGNGDGPWYSASLFVDFSA